MVKNRFVNDVGAHILYYLGMIFSLNISSHKDWKQKTVFSFSSTCQAQFPRIEENSAF
jgi:hypothetical protein